MRVTVVAVGRLKEKFYEQAVAEYAKRLGRYCKLEVIQVADEKTPDGASETVERQIKEKEGKRILAQIKDGAYVIALAIQGEMVSSEELADKMGKLGLNGVSHLVFVIGGSLGLSEEVLRRADYKLSFSRMTFPHQLMRVVLLEQVYRGFCILGGTPYHK
ncbi:23S rRNA (pseudouridine(1915)-N(3))-methyltransferase RlmH [Lachnoclostridium sp. An14]|uniref:23S rRNA (pseudouridine(1915)-N(3))-methyltransferase RlmH n=1 Tax=Lachnoclostridium sp. An14 TaxID=1965562 RepID=UPI000B385A40|nr:23S rRNA (pseudouridine(1915)-N(3))-methyltransferase RlmH [Lachnoclostridium sp. An14]